MWDQRFRALPGLQSSVFQRFFKGNQVRFTRGSCRRIRSDGGAVVIPPVICARCRTRSGENAVLGACCTYHGSSAMNPRRGQVPANGFPVIRAGEPRPQDFGSLSPPFFMTRQNQKSEKFWNLTFPCISIHALSGESPRTCHVCGAKRISLRNFSAFWLIAERQMFAKWPILAETGSLWSWARLA